MKARENPWPNYYRAQIGREPRRLLFDALKLAAGPGFAVDLGCGSGIETVVLLERDWRVLAIDKEAAGIDLLLQDLSDEAVRRLETRVAPFDGLHLPVCDMVHASYSLPFCHADEFPALWRTVVGALRPGGLLVGQLFGVADTWAESGDVMNFHTLDGVQTLLAGLEIVRLDEDRHDGDSLVGPKHWHVFDIIARHPGTTPG